MDNFRKRIEEELVKLADRPFPDSNKYRFGVDLVAPTAILTDGMITSIVRAVQKRSWDAGIGSEDDLVSWVVGETFDAVYCAESLVRGVMFPSKSDDKSSGLHLRLASSTGSDMFLINRWMAHFLEARHAGMLAMTELFDHVESTWNGGDDLLPAAMGLVGEVGEVIDYYKKGLFKFGFAMDESMLHEELGDVGYYIGAVIRYSGREAVLSVIFDLLQVAVGVRELPWGEGAIQLLAKMAESASSVMSVAAHLRGGGDGDRKIPTIALINLADLFVTVCDSFGAVSQKVMAQNREKLSGGKHGWPVVQ